MAAEAATVLVADEPDLVNAGEFGELTAEGLRGAAVAADPKRAAPTTPRAMIFMIVSSSDEISRSLR
ncbi:hypothetical protein ACQPTN_07470 [Bradyrhizobium sp. 13971]